MHATGHQPSLMAPRPCMRLGPSPLSLASWPYIGPPGHACDVAPALSHWPPGHACDGVPALFSLENCDADGYPKKKLAIVTPGGRVRPSSTQRPQPSRWRAGPRAVAGRRSRGGRSSRGQVVTEVAFLTAIRIISLARSHACDGAQPSLIGPWPCMRRGPALSHWPLAMHAAGPSPHSLALIGPWPFRS